MAATVFSASRPAPGDIAGILRVTGAGVDRAEVRRWARQLGYLEVWDAVVEAVDAPDRPPGPGVP